MVKHFALLFLLTFYSISFTQNEEKKVRFEFANRIELSNYLGGSNYYGGSELKIDLATMTHDLVKISASTGYFIVDSYISKDEPHMVYSYVPLYLNAAGFTKNKKWYCKLTFGIPLYINEDSKIISDDHLWPNIGEIRYQAARPDELQIREKIIRMSEVRIGWYFSKHVGVNAGVKLYNVRTSLSRSASYYFPTLGLDYRFNYKSTNQKKPSTD